MQNKSLKYDDSLTFIKRDLKRLKKWKSIEDDVYACYKIINGMICETRYPPTFDFCGGLIFERKCFYGTLLCYKDRIAIKEPPLSPSEGARLIFAIIKEPAVFIPLILFKVSEERTFYNINSKKFRLTSSNFGKIIIEKLKSL